MTLVLPQAQAEGPVAPRPMVRTEPAPATGTAPHEECRQRNHVAPIAFILCKTNPLQSWPQRQSRVQQGIWGEGEIHRPGRLGQARVIWRRQRSRHFGFLGCMRISRRRAETRPKVPAHGDAFVLRKVFVLLKMDRNARTSCRPAGGCTRTTLQRQRMGVGSARVTSEGITRVSSTSLSLTQRGLGIEEGAAGAHVLGVPVERLPMAGLANRETGSCNSKRCAGRRSRRSWWVSIFSPRPMSTRRAQSTRNGSANSDLAKPWKFRAALGM